jgi:hypothetical protein
VSLYQRKPGGPYHVEVEWMGYPRPTLARTVPSLSGERNREAEAHAALTRAGLKPA